MEINLLKNKNNINLESYGKNKFVVSGKEFNNPILILKDSVIEKKKLRFKDVKKKFLNEIIKKYKLDFLILGSNKIDFNLFYKKDSNIELMPTDAAVRTINILFSENRNVGALLFPIN